jgi:hypothetical protein
MVGVILAATAAVIPAGFAAWDGAPAFRPQAAPAATVVAPESRDAAPAETVAASVAAAPAARLGANNNPVAAARDDDACFLPAPEPAAAYASPAAAQREIDPMLADFCARNVVRHGRGANNVPETP